MPKIAVGDSPLADIARQTRCAGDRAGFLPVWPGSPGCPVIRWMPARYGLSTT